MDNMPIVAKRNSSSSQVRQATRYSRANSQLGAMIDERGAVPHAEQLPQDLHTSRGVWLRFVDANKRICKRFFQPRLYPVSHMAALEWWFTTRMRTLEHCGRLLEFGSGTTFPVSRLVGQQFEACEATDIEDVPEYCWPNGVLFQRCEATRLPFESNHFDVVAIRSVMEHVAEPAAVFKEISRVLKPGGRVFMNLPNKWDYVSVIARVAGRFKSRLLRTVVRPGWDDFPVLYRCNTRRALLAALAESDLTLEHFRPFPAEPAYLKFFVPLYLAGAVYQFAIALLCIDWLQPSFVVILRKKSPVATGSTPDTC
jgi:SAM-dependent methyltransferase